ncbi:MAG: DnaJ domain-containing protein, partial [Atribacterota bacterium]|nr:DnaJ domain-containing protein [Atribacterota bacterium]
KFEVSENELRNFIRTVALSNDNSRYIFTIVDETWCIDNMGNCLWGVRLPLKEGWEKVESSSKNYNTSKDVEEALKIFGLELPFENEDLKSKYKELAKKWHPDINPDNPEAEHMMKKVNNAAEVLTGIDTKSLPSYMGTEYVSKESIQSFNVNGFNVSIRVEFGSARFASDWIYASSFSDEYYNCYIGGYSGKIIEINENGNPLRVYDIGTVPKQIIKSDKLLYLLTDTRLYILEEDKLISIIDVYDEGSLVMAETGFGLLQAKKFQWFNKTGKLEGTLLTNNPIRKVLFSNNQLIIETRQRRAIINGVNNWWI